MPTFHDVSLLPYYVSEVLSYFAVVGTAYLAWRLVRVYERRSVEPERLNALARRVEYLEAAVETVEDRVRETVDAQHFTTSLLVAQALPTDRRLRQTE